MGKCWNTKNSSEDTSCDNLNLGFLGDEAFDLSENFLHQNAQGVMPHIWTIFNYRLSHVWNVVENFGISSSRFRVLHKVINMELDDTCYVVLEICDLNYYLHVFSHSHSTHQLDREDLNAGDWHNNAVELIDLETIHRRRITLEAK